MTNQAFEVCCVASRRACGTSSGGPIAQCNSAVQAQFDRVVTALADHYPEAAEHLEAAREDLLAFTRPKRPPRPSDPRSPSSRFHEGINERLHRH